MNLKDADARTTVVQKMVFEKNPWGKAVNSYEVEKENWTFTRPDGVTVINDIRYADTYPNSYLDIWYPDVNHTGRRPAIISFHGGGSLFGDKKSGDPMALKPEDPRQIMDLFLEKGYIYIQANYAFAPEYRFPVQIRQVDQAVGFIKSHADVYGIDPSQLIVAGSSAGACYTEIYGLCVSDPAYARQLGFTPSAATEQIRALIINESALNFDSIIPGDDMWALHTTWFGVDDILNDPIRDLVNVPRHIKDQYPPTFITASNDGPVFFQDAEALCSRLREIGAECVYYFVPYETDHLTHGYANDFNTNPHARECVETAIQFLEKQRGTWK